MAARRTGLFTIGFLSSVLVVFLVFQRDHLLTTCPSRLREARARATIPLSPSAVPSRAVCAPGAWRNAKRHSETVVSQPTSCSHPLRRGKTSSPHEPASPALSAQTPQTADSSWQAWRAMAGTRQGSRYHGDAFPTVSSPPRAAPPPPSPAGIFVELTAWDAVFEDHHAVI